MWATTIWPTALCSQTSPAASRQRTIGQDCLNTSLPAHLVQQIDTDTNARSMTRSGFLARAAQQAIHD